MSESSTQPSARPDRYGSPGAVLSGRLLVVGIVLLIVVCGFYIYRQYTTSTTADVTLSTAGFTRPSDNQLDVTVDVTRDDPATPAYCIVQALNYDKTEVGRREFVIPAGEAKTTRLVVSVPTTEVAVAGLPYGCSSSIPSYLTH